MPSTQFASTPAPAICTEVAPLNLMEVGVALSLGESRHLLVGGRVARVAVSCLLQSEQGDRALAVETASGELFILHVLSRMQGEEATIVVPGAVQLSLQQRRVVIQGWETIALTSLLDVDITSAHGNLRLNARNLFQTVSDTLVQSATHMVAQVDHCLMQAKKLLRFHGEHVLVTANKDVKVDGERISMG